MKIISTEAIEGFVAGDNTLIRELLHPQKNNVPINYSLAHATVGPGETSVPHILKNSEVYYILAGKGRVFVGKEEKMMEKGDLVHIPPNVEQYIENVGIGDLVFLCIVSPPWEPSCEVIL